MRTFSITAKTELAPEVHPHINQGCMQDITTASSYRLGEHGESILNAGKAPVEGICGQNNNYKSSLAISRDLQSLNVMTMSSGQLFCSESTAQMSRVEGQQVMYANLKDIDLVAAGAYSITNTTKYTGDEYHAHMRNYCNEKRDLKEAEATTPFLGRDGKLIKCKIPTHFLIDSFSNMTISAVDDMYDSHNIGEKGHNMVGTKEGSAKTTFMRTAGSMCSSSGSYLTLTAHVDKSIKLDPYAPTEHKLNFMKKGLELKNVSNKYSYLTNNLWYCYNAVKLLHSDKTLLYPSKARGNSSRSGSSLMAVTTENLRGKFGPSGVPFQLIYDQIRGLLRGLSEYHYLKTNKAIGSGYFGMNGSQQKQQMCLYPGITLQRTTVYDQIEENYGLQQALRYTSEIAQMREIWTAYDGPELDIEPEDLYKQLTEVGYDVKWLMENTRPYYTLKEEEDQHFGYYMSTMDLLKMANGKYYPYWYDEAAKKHGLNTDIKNKAEAKEHIAKVLKTYLRN
tara:strand:- start:21945 stop:23465 length:1521 start_codon:yes stop_codon:yes gene_type:complete